MYDIHKNIHLWSYELWALLWINMAESQIAQQFLVVYFGIMFVI